MAGAWGMGLAMAAGAAATTDSGAPMKLLTGLGLVWLLSGCVFVPKQPCDGTFIQADRRWHCTVVAVQSVSWYPYEKGQASCYVVASGKEQP